MNALSVLIDNYDHYEALDLHQQLDCRDH